jgi:hypothetical protein
MAPIALSNAVRTRLRDRFPPQDQERAETLLLQYGGAPAELQVEQVRLDILDASESSLEKMRDLVTLAKTDFRDLIMLAEDRRRRGSKLHPPYVHKTLQLSACLIAGASIGYALALFIEPNALDFDIAPSSWRRIAALSGVVLGLAGYRLLMLMKPY